MWDQKTLSRLPYVAWTALRVSELDDIWAVTSRYIDTDRADFEAQLRALPKVGLWQVRDGPLVGLVNFDVYPVVRQGRVTTIIFTSSVVIDARFRGRQLILKTGLRILPRTKSPPSWTSSPNSTTGPTGARKRV